ncbi:hypothetical protein SPRG_20593 [Saprolegnia parasitica CBS 223.65]|uniref:Amino acid permease/ SLC12A domain-containing protein n=1 Tax=Saprolegnia parasitica (strain CBS 223.65) TaxID=695850 RepID=A0A067CIS4_SAPPC|nr:hypothetical protein SPRG_20593 [Saprolegnia parasitica CBS 223.65]KDO26456.1 hypothetical protein SPRG_20593 [Saprolegnia parasitica CBS 223.65]|eukprot:XP_012202930.1 hypothetical protein SPRG_20593 [Saprolegnia parasitica CBS 223.65]
MEIHYPDDLRPRRRFTFEVDQEAKRGPSWVYPGLGNATGRLHPAPEELAAIHQEMHAPKHFLSEWYSTGISGNDVLSSCLYSSGIVASKAGKFAPFANLLVACVMYLFRFIYVEVVSAIPLNGGSYNTMLNSTSKRVAALTSALAIIAYLATGVVSAVSASDYLRKQIEDLNHIHCATGILGTFAILNVLGMSESAKVALTIFIAHTITLAGRFSIWLSVDGFIVLSGSVLTSYVGITGLVRRLASDRVLPEFFLAENAWRHTNHYIILSYFVIATSLVWILEGNVTMLSSIYSYSFLGLLVLFSVGAMLFKLKRGDMPRETNTPWWKCLVGFAMGVVGFFGIMLGDPRVSIVFLLYFFSVAGLILLMLERIFVLRACMLVMKSLCPSQWTTTERVLMPPLLPTDASTPNNFLGKRTIVRAIKTINEPPIIFFCKHLSLTILNKAILYVRRNEHTDNLRIVHVYAKGTKPPSDFEDIVGVFDCMYPKLRIDAIAVEGTFDPILVQWISENQRIPTNMMFIRQPDNVDAHKVSMLGVRVITG